MITRALPLLFLSASVASAQLSRGPDLAPKLGAAIPSVSANTPDGKLTVDLAKPKRLTVLIFGSHT